MNEQCAQYNECDALDPFTRAGKAVVQIEYTTPTATFCSAATTARRSASKMALALTAAPWAPCW